MGLNCVTFSGFSTFGIKTIVVSFHPSGIVAEFTACNTSFSKSSPNIFQKRLKNIAWRPFIQHKYAVKSHLLQLAAVWVGGILAGPGLGPEPGFHDLVFTGLQLASLHRRSTRCIKMTTTVNHMTTVQVAVILLSQHAEPDT